MKLLVMEVRLLLALVSFSTAALGGATSPRIAVVGAGIGGTAAAHFMSQLMPEARLDLYESGLVGGRLATATVAGRQYEIGGGFIHPENR